MSDELTNTLRAIAERVALEDPGYTRLTDAFVERLRAGAGMGAPEIGGVFPDFVLPSLSGELFVSDEAFQQPTMIVFLRGHWCPFCAAQAGAILARLTEIAAAGATAVFITPEVSAYGARLAGGEPVSVLYDVDNGLAASLGLLAVMDDAMVASLLADGYDLPRYQGALSWAVPIPAVFVLAPGGRVVTRWIDADFRDRMPVSTLLQAVRDACAGN